MVNDGKGYNAIRTWLRSAHSGDAATKAVQNYVQRIRSGGGVRAIRGLPGSDGDECAIVSSVAELLPHDASIRAMLKKGLGCIAIRTQLRLQHGVDVPKKTIENYVMRIQSDTARTMRGSHGVQGYSDAPAERAWVRGLEKIS